MVRRAGGAPRRTRRYGVPIVRTGAVFSVILVRMSLAPPEGLHDLIAAANRPLTDPEIHHQIGQSPARFELYHFALSLCSQKVRSCLIEKGAPFIAHDINLQLPHLANYDPAYVRLRMRGWNRDQPLVGDYSGRSSTASEGFDPAVVPTLVDLEAGEVCVDSLKICRYIDHTLAGPRSLIPDDRAEAVESELAIVDAMPQVAILYGAHPDGDFRPDRLKKNMPGVHDRKIDKIRSARSGVSDDPSLLEAYDAKIRKEESARSFVSTPDKMREAVTEILDGVAALDGRLVTDYACGAELTMADLFWAVALFRLQWLGMAFAWEGGHPLNARPRPRVAAYAQRLFERPQFRQAVIDWPRTPRTEFVEAFYTD